MNRFFTLTIVCSFLTLNTNAQSITGITMQPTNPTESDTIYIYADLMFPNMNCDLDMQGHSLAGNTIVASAHHCMGMLTAICSATDTFKIDPLPPGTYTFDLTLTSGSAPAPCTPGIVPNDNDTMMFTVMADSVPDTSGNAITEILDIPVSIYPNPTNDLVYVEIEDPSMVDAIVVYDLHGREIIRERTLGTRNEFNLGTGVYFLRLHAGRYTTRATRVVVTGR